ncbi:MAG: hypothetical protein B1H13_10565 [Desulfobacteraceae bacterium 4484_190.3]|nr:MAG: hypothetical protein B1H13_10565 [Desulfobacteraceae bacterium 4484_190.3]
MEQKAIHALDEGRIMAEYGPMRLVISAWVGRLPQRNMCISAARKAFEYFEGVAAFKDKLARPLHANQECLQNPIAQAMVDSIREVGDSDLTPLAAVAGTLADAVADFLFDRGMTKVVVNNGGDIAVRLIGDEKVIAGIGNYACHGPVSNRIVLDSSISTWGIATSGLGGRSFTRGVATAVTVVARTASLADAAATAVANASFIEDANVIQRPAQEIDPNSDIADVPVTVSVGPLSEKKKELAVSRALKRARSLADRKVILGAVVEVQGRFAADAFARARLANTGPGIVKTQIHSSEDEEGGTNNGSEKICHSPGGNSF